MVLWIQRLAPTAHKYCKGAYNKFAITWAHTTVTVVATRNNGESSGSYNNFTFVRTWVMSIKMERIIKMTCDEYKHVVRVKDKLSSMILHA